MILIDAQAEPCKASGSQQATCTLATFSCTVSNKVELFFFSPLASMATFSASADLLGCEAQDSDTGLLWCPL